MAIILNDNLKINAGKPVDSKYLSSLNLPYTGVTQVNNDVAISERYVGLTVNVNNDEYWYYTGTTDGDLVLKTATGTGSGERIEREFSQASHGFIVGDVVSSSGGTFVKAIADGTQDAETFGIVTEVADANTFTIVFAGYVEDFNPTGYTVNAGNTYWLSPTSAGELTPIEPSNAGEITKPVYHAITSTEGLVFQYRGITLFTGQTGGGAVSGVTDGFNLGNGLDVFLNVTGDTMLFRTIAGTGSTFAFIQDDTIYIGSSGSSSVTNIGDGEGLIFSGTSGGTSLLRSLKAGTGITITTTGSTVIITQSGTTNAIGAARDGTYDDGLFPFTPSTPTGFAIDDINEFLSLLAPEPAPDLDQISASGTYFDGKLSFGTTNGIVGYSNVSTAAGNSAIDVNGIYFASGTRQGITKTAVTGVLNDDIVGGAGDIPFSDNAFGQAYTGELELELNGVLINTLDLTSSLTSIVSTVGGTTLNVGEVKFVKFDNGNDFAGARYRTGTYVISTTAMQNGFNYMRITHSGIGSPTTTNYIEWVYDPEGTTITILNEQFVNLNLTGSKFISGVEYNTGGSVDLIATGTSVYRNVYSAEANAITFPSTNNLSSTPSVISIAGTGIISGFTQALPNLNTALASPENTDINIDATLPINSNIILGDVGTLGNIQAAVAIDHPFPDEEATSSTLSDTGFLVYNITQGADEGNEDFTGEVGRLETDDYSTVGYATIDGGGKAWDSTQHLVLGSGTHNNGLLVFNGELLYPSAAYLTSTYGITTGNFGAVSNSPAGNPNYSTASGIREHYRLFKSNNTTTQSTITFEITHTGVAGDFLTDGGTGGTPSGDDIKLEFVIKRSGGATHGWANPFASSGNPEGIANLSTTHGGGVTTVQATLSVIPRIANNDIVVVKVRASAGWTNRISNIEITNI